MSKKIKWGCIQPLTGGMYIGALNAIGHNAEWIISYKGLDAAKTDESGKIISASNEYNLVNWLKKTGQMVPYYSFDRGMFQNDLDLNPTILLNNESKLPEYDDMDLVVAVPVCSGLSAATIAGQDTKDTRNCNMLWIANYALNVVKPKVYIFENAPALLSEKGKPVRDMLEEIAKNAGYSVVYYKTDTKYHHNCQRRPRTFVYFLKYKTSDEQIKPVFEFIKDQVEINEYLSLIPEDATQQEPFEMSEVNKVLLGYLQNKIGADWRNIVGQCPTTYIVRNGKVSEFKEYMYANHEDIPNDKKEKIEAFFNHVKTKLDANMNFYATTIYQYGETTPSIQFKSIKTMLHPKVDRLFSIRECLHLMGMPFDFELFGDPEVDGPKIGQNVPVKTAEFIVKQAINLLTNYEQVETTPIGNTIIFDNTNETIKNSVNVNKKASIELF